MRLQTLSIGLLALLPAFTCAWTKEDREIFRVRDEIITHEGSNVTFYDFLGVKPSATIDDIDKAYKKRSRALHPDKVQSQLQAERAKASKKQKKGGKKGVHVAKAPSQSEIKTAVKAAGERQARLSIVANILRGPGRDRYDHFVSNGFPTWKGTEYFYNRYRPGLGTAMAGVLLFGGGAAHYIALFMGWKRRREFVERYIKFARHAAWGENLGINVPGIDAGPVAAPEAAPIAAARGGSNDDPQQPMNRKQRRLQEQNAKREAAKESGGKRARAGAGGAARRGDSASGSATPQPQSQNGPTGSKKRVVAENGKVLVVDSLGDVYLEQQDAEGNVEEFLLDPNEIPCPTWKDTAVVRVPNWLFGVIAGRLLPTKYVEEVEGETLEEEDVAKETSVLDDEESDVGKKTPSTDSAEDFELLEKSVDELGTAKASGSQTPGGGKKRKGKKR